VTAMVAVAGARHVGSLDATRSRPRPSS
jgi:hypothetical protein